MRLHPEFERFFMKRRDLTVLFDKIKCNAWQNIVEKNGFA
jgi:hypothetical protein